MIISSIVAASENNAIGIDNDLPWQMPADLKFFKETTLGHYVIMGRKSFDSVGRPLPGRTNIVVTRNKEFYHSGVITVHSIAAALLVALEAKQEEVFITAFFPELDMTKWKLTGEAPHKADEKNKYDYTFCTYERPW